MLVRVRLRGVWQPILQVPPGLTFMQPIKQLLAQAVLASEVRPVSLKLIVGQTHTGSLTVLGTGVIVLRGRVYACSHEAAT